MGYCNGLLLLVWRRCFIQYDIISLLTVYNSITLVPNFKTCSKSLLSSYCIFISSSLFSFFIYIGFDTTVLLSDFSFLLLRTFMSPSFSWPNISSGVSYLIFYSGIFLFIYGTRYPSGPSLNPTHLYWGWHYDSSKLWVFVTKQNHL